MRQAGARFSSSLAETPERAEDEDASNAVRPLVDAVRVRVPRHATQRALEREMEAASAGAAQGTPVYAFLQPGLFATEAEFADAVEQALLAGLNRFSLYELGLLSRRQLEWIERRERPWVAALP